MAQNLILFSLRSVEFYIPKNNLLGFDDKNAWHQRTQRNSF
jgi:hypothetical protein